MSPTGLNSGRPSNFRFESFSPHRADMIQRGRKVRSVQIAAISTPKAQEVVTFGGLVL
jgi:hypothetical protein